MGSFFEDTMQGLLEALEIEKENASLKEKENMPDVTNQNVDSNNKVN